MRMEEQIMTIAELIEKLKGYGDDKEVYVYDEDGRLTDNILLDADNTSIAITGRAAHLKKLL